MSFYNILFLHFIKDVETRLRMSFLDIVFGTQYGGKEERSF